MNSKKILAAAVSVAAIASLTACGGVKDDTTAGADSGNAITIGTTDKITSLDPAGSYDNGSYAVQIQVFPFLYAQDYNTSELSRTSPPMTVPGTMTAPNSPSSSRTA